MKDITIKAFFALVRAGLWGSGNPDLRIDGTTDLNEVYQLAQEQSVQGLVLAGLEHSDIKPPKKLLLRGIGELQMIEQRNREMNGFVAELIEKLRKEDIYAILVKGQGVAQCYEKPLWRSSGDVDLLLNEQNYYKAKQLLKLISNGVQEERDYNLHLAMKVYSWDVELHGTLRAYLGNKVDRVIDGVQKDTFGNGKVRVWRNNNTDVFLPAPDNDVIFVFTHILMHFFRGGIGLRQICDWCRLLWTYKNEINIDLLKSRLKDAELISEWYAFAAIAVEQLGMPVESMPLYRPEKKWKRKAYQILTLMSETGSFGHNRDYSYYEKYPYLVIKIISLWRHTKDNLRHMTIFPKDALRVWLLRFKEGIDEVVKKNKDASRQM